MRTIRIFALLLLLIPVTVILLQIRASREEAGSPSDYLVIEEPVEPSRPAEEASSPGIPVLCYHYLSENGDPVHFIKVLGTVFLNLPLLDDTEYWSTRAGLFEEQLRWLADNGYRSLDMDELVEILGSKSRIDEKLVCLTFDDGDSSLLKIGLPLLQKYDMKATLFVLTREVGNHWRDLEMMTWAELDLLRQSGHVQIESHTYNQHYKVKDDSGNSVPVHLFTIPENQKASAVGEAAILRDLLRSRQDIREHLGHDCRYLAWPYGFGSSGLDRLASQAGFRASFTLKAGPNVPGRNTAWSLHRFTITARTTQRNFKEMLESTQPRKILPAR